MELRDVLKFDPLLAAEEITGNSYKTDKVTEDLGLALMFQHIEHKNSILNKTGDSTYSMDVLEYQDILKSIGFELAKSWNFTVKEREETEYIYGHQKLGIILYFTTYGSSVNSGSFYYCWKPNNRNVGNRVTSSGRYESESHENWRGDERFEIEYPEDLYWAGNHDCREGIRYNISQLKRNGTFYPIWPKPSQCRKMPGLYFMNTADWEEVKPGSRETINFVFLKKYSELPDWCAGIIGNSCQ